MKNILLAALVTIASASSAFADDVGVSISIGQPGFYGRIDIGDFPQPMLIYREPRIIEHRYDHHAPIYMRVPPGHAKHWDKHCGQYHACGERVYFVQDDWYNHEYVPRYQERHGNKHSGQGSKNNHQGEGHGKDKGHGGGKDKGH